MTHRPLALIEPIVVDPSQGLNEVKTVLVQEGRIHALETHIAPSLLEEDYVLIDARGKVLMPGLVDCQVRTGEPGNEHEETLKSASLAACAGGVTTMVTSPETSPVIDDIALVEFILRTARETAANKVHVMGALTKGLQGHEMSELHLMHDAGAVAFTNGTKSITNAQVMRRALAYARDFDGLIVHHVEEPTLIGNGVMNEGELASRLGLPGIPKEAEIIMLERDLRLAALTAGRYHAASISCAQSVDLMRQAKRRGLNVTCGASVNNLILNEIDIGPYRTFFKLSPPLRDEEDRRALVEGVRDGTVDLVHSDHTPLDVDRKRHPFADATDGAIGLETLAAALLRLVHNEDITLSDFVRVLSKNPAKLFDLEAGSLKKGKPADMILIDLDAPWILQKENLQSRSKNTPFEDARFTGRVVRTFVNGIEVFTTPS